MPEHYHSSRTGGALIATRVAPATPGAARNPLTAAILPRGRAARLRGSAPGLRVLGLPAHRGVDARAPARMIVEEEFLEWCRLQLAILGELQRHLCEAIWLGRGIEAVEVRLVLLHPHESVQHRCQDEQVRGQDRKSVV